jgi:hypothetical protein
LGFQVTATMVDIPEIDKGAVKNIAKNLDVNFRVRKFSY